MLVTPAPDRHHSTA